MSKLNFYIENDLVFDTKGNQIPEDEKGIVKVNIDGEIRRFIRVKLVKWLEDNPDIRQAKVPKVKRPLSQYDAMQKELEPQTSKTKPKKTPQTVKVPQKKVMGRPRFRPRDENGNLIKIIKPRKPRRRIYARDEFDRRIDKLPKGTGSYFGREGKRVECITTGKIYKSIYEAGKLMGINRACIRKVVLGKCKQTKGYQFKFI